MICPLRFIIIQVADLHESGQHSEGGRIDQEAHPLLKGLLFSWPANRRTVWHAIPLRIRPFPAMTQATSTSIASPTLRRPPNNGRWQAAPPWAARTPPSPGWRASCLGQTSQPTRQSDTIVRRSPEPRRHCAHEKVSVSGSECCWASKIVVPIAANWVPPADSPLIRAIQHNSMPGCSSPPCH